eukprot:GDKI01025359.1.p1 GENE.GDKI01025359.1~~GDKI01025359.1.p1  ORF type:complete len:169 (+),score=32.21 GDKI01025359.1:58-507(+)
MARPQRWAWTAAKEWFRFRAGRAYESFYYAQYNNKYWMVLIFPLAMNSVRWTAENKLGYNVFITDESLLPDDSKKVTGGWTNGKKLYLDDNTTVAELKALVYEGKDKIPENVAVGCRGRMMEDSDNLALAVRAFCKRDPKIVLWREETH